MWIFWESLNLCSASRAYATTPASSPCGCAWASPISRSVSYWNDTADAIIILANANSTHSKLPTLHSATFYPIFQDPFPRTKYASFEQNAYHQVIAKVFGRIMRFGLRGQLFKLWKEDDQSWRFPDRWDSRRGCQKWQLKYLLACTRKWDRSIRWDAQIHSLTQKQTAFEGGNLKQMKPTSAESHRQSLSLMVLYPFLVFLNLLRNRSRWSKTQEWATWSLQCRSWKKGMLITHIERFDLRVKTLHFECARWIRVFYESGNNLRILAWSSEWGRDVPAWSKFCLSAATRKGPSASSSDAYWWHRWV